MEKHFLYKFLKGLKFKGKLLLKMEGNLFLKTFFYFNFDKFVIFSFFLQNKFSIKFQWLKDFRRN